MSFRFHAGGRAAQPSGLSPGLVGGACVGRRRPGGRPLLAATVEGRDFVFYGMAETKIGVARLDRL
jgi:hypothetical protein